MSFAGLETPINETFGKDASFTLPHLIGSMSISPSGRDVVLASKEGLRIIDLDSPYSPPRFLPHRTPWEVADVQWSPFAERDYWIISTSNQKALVWNVNASGWRNSIEHVLHGHSRAITDINFSAHHPDKLATCAVDSYVHCWDLRCASPLVNSFSDWFAGATQVKWSRQDEHVIASSHDRFLHIWDARYGARPARTIEAHNTKIYGIDWNRFEPSKIVTCSLDRTIKFWDTQNEQDIPDRVIETGFPVWRARHTPFGWGLMVMPQRGNGDLHLYDRRPAENGPEDENAKPVHVFRGHKGQVKEFLWRGLGTVKDGIDYRDFQLVSWGTDRELRLHVLPEQTFSSVGYEKGVSKPQRLRFTRRGAKYRTFRDEPSETDFAVTGLSRTDSIPASNQFLRVRGRLSTNMGISRVPATQGNGWLQNARASRRTDMHGRGAGRPDTDPITWMKSVKIGASLNNDMLAEEITNASDKFKNVDFEMINITQRRATVSLHSPWGETKDHPVYMRLDFKFPKLYPKDASAVVHVQRTSSISFELQKSLSTDINAITDAHRNCSKGCVESIIRYVLREQPVDQIITKLLKDSMSESKLIAAADGAGDGSEDSDDDDLFGPTTTVGHAHLVDPVPLTKGCAALWAENGRLVCFFEPKESKESSLLDTLVGRLDDSEGDKLFGGFGRFQADSPSRKLRDKPSTIGEDSNSDTSDQASLFSSSTSSSESSIGIGLERPHATWQRPALIPSQRYKSADGSQKSTLQNDTVISGKAKKNIVSVRDFSDILPARRDLASEYQVIGEATTITAHNSRIADQHSLRATAATWRLVHSFLSAPDDSIARQSLSQQSANSADALSNEAAAEENHVSWKKPLVTVQVFPSLLQFYERTCNIQMLGILSGIFLQLQIEKLQNFPNHATDATELRPEGQSLHRLSPSHSYGKHVDRGSQVLGTQVDSLTSQRTTYSQSPNDHISDRSDASSLFAASTLASRRMASTNVSSRAPSVVIRNTSVPGSTLNSAVASLAGSPENYRLSSRRSEPVVNYPIATASLQALARPPSPTGGSVRRIMPTYDISRSSRVSPESDVSRLSKAAVKSSMSPATLHGSSGESQRFEQRKSQLRSPLVSSSKALTCARPKMKLKTRFVGTQPLAQRAPVLPDSEYLDFCKKCVSYTEQYATQLEVWRLWTQRAELVRLCAEITFLLRKICQNDGISRDRSHTDLGLSFRRCCPACASYMVPIEKNRVAIGWQCVNAECVSSKKIASKRHRCPICETVIQGLAVPCTQCNHITCWECSEEWFGRTPVRTSTSSTSSRSGNRTQSDNTCPAGCGCQCSRLSEIFVPYPAADTSESEIERTVTPTTPRSEGYQELGSQSSMNGDHRARRGQSISTIDAGANSAINSLLALNLATRHRSTSGTVKLSHGSVNHDAMPQVSSTRIADSDAVDELLPWSSNRSATLARGSGPGLSRGLSRTDSSSTIRQADSKI